MPSVSEKSVKLADYIFLRLRHLGIQSIFGVPGDYNLRLLDFVEPAGLHWVGNCNELNAAYAADGYARINGVSALITTFGVGELSAINGIAGAFAEKAPVIHIVGTPSRHLQQSRVQMHHTFADGEYRRFAAAHANVTVAQANLTDATTAPDQVDHILELALFHQRPVYLEIPDDMVDVFVSGANLHRKPKLGLPIPPETNEEESKVKDVLNRIYEAKNPMILVDGESRGLGILPQIEELIKKTNWPTWTTLYGKGLIDETLQNVHGVLQGKYGPAEAEAYFKSSDLVLYFGPHLSDTNTYNFTTVPDEAASISFSQNSVRIGSQIHRSLPTQRFLDKLLELLDLSRVAQVDGPPKHSPQTPQLESSDLIVQNKFYRVVNSILRAGDIVLAETGTASHGGRTFQLPPNTRFFTAVTWLSIGYMLPATLGAAIAQRELAALAGVGSDQKRAILFIGDGSRQMTAQELSIIIKEKLNVTIFVINNSGYTIEREIHGRDMSYNDIACWNHSWALGLFGLDEERALRNFYRAKTWGELDSVLQSEEFQSGEGVKLVEVYMEKEDCIGSLQDLLQQQISKEEKSYK